MIDQSTAVEAFLTVDGKVWVTVEIETAPAALSVSQRAELESRIRQALPVEVGKFRIVAVYPGSIRMILEFDEPADLVKFPQIAELGNGQLTQSLAPTLGKIGKINVLPGITEILTQLENLSTASQLDRILSMVEMPTYLWPSSKLEHGARCIEVIKWAKSKGSHALKTLAGVLEHQAGDC